MPSIYPLVALFGVSLIVRVGAFRIGAFNVQILGPTKAGKTDVMNTLAKIIQRYDIVLIQEIRDSKGTAIEKLLDLVNEVGSFKYDFVISARLGRSISKEQYAFLYRLNADIQVLDTYQYPDDQDDFEREPLAVMFRSWRTALNEFVLVGVHVDPDEAVQEINDLAEVHNNVRTHWGTDNIMIMGDFNADCSYVGKKASKELVLRDPMYTWLIGDDLDTTTKSTDCAYDRMVLTGDSFIQSVVPNSAQVYRFDLEYNLDVTQTTAVSDHYPVEFEMTVVPGTSLGGESMHQPADMSDLAEIKRDLYALRMDVMRLERHDVLIERMLLTVMDALGLQLADDTIN